MESTEFQLPPFFLILLQMEQNHEQKRWIQISRAKETAPPRFAAFGKVSARWVILGLLKKWWCLKNKQYKYLRFVHNCWKRVWKSLFRLYKRPLFFQDLTTMTSLTDFEEKMEQRQKCTHYKRVRRLFWREFET